MKPKVIIFDLDGVLVDSSELVSDYFMHSYPTMTHEIMDEILRGNFHERLEKFKTSNAPRSETPEEKEARSKAYTVQKLTTPLFPGIKKLLESLNEEGFILMVNTSAFERNSVPVLEYANVKDLFDFIATAEVSKNKTEKFNMILEKYAITADESVFVTDTVGDIIEAQKAGIQTIAVTWGAHSAEHFNREPFDNLIAIVDSIEELESKIKNK